MLPLRNTTSPLSLLPLLLLPIKGFSDTSLHRGDPQCRAGCSGGPRKLKLFIRMRSIPKREKKLRGIGICQNKPGRPLSANNQPSRKIQCTTTPRAPAEPRMCQKARVLCFHGVSRFAIRILPIKSTVHLAVILQQRQVVQGSPVCRYFANASPVTPSPRHYRGHVLLSNATIKE